MITTRILRFAIVLVAMLALSLTGVNFSEAALTGSFNKDNEISISFSAPVDEAWGKNPANYNVFQKTDPDIRIPVASVTLDPRRTSATLKFQDPLNMSSEYTVEAKDVMSDGKLLGKLDFSVKKSQAQVLFTIIIGAMLINNFVFTKYLGLCIFFGVSQKKDTAIGMGITFTLVMVLSAIFCWALYTYVLTALQLQFLQIIVFIGTVAIFVQAMDTMLRKVNPFLFKKLGVYLVLIVTNCIILAVPLINVDSGYGLFESMSEGLGAGVGFAIALFLMACVREKLELCRVPAVFRGLPIAFVVAGLFALAFLGFSGLSIF
ncbi:MAG: Rnf-Nqr domain containing protein [Syntrophaceae bacterium]|nr:Rnf-Nqr domain containing protein [Syntrophaceae bacterium]